jgi:hypothetical protein
MQYALIIPPGSGMLLKLSVQGFAPASGSIAVPPRRYFYNRFPLVFLLLTKAIDRRVFFANRSLAGSCILRE